MTRRGRTVFGSLLFLVVILILVIFLGYRLLRKSLPKIHGTTQLRELEEAVHVYRDSFGVPHIFAENERDLFRAAGYVTAQDRLWQIDLARRVATGRLSEIFGKTTLEQDKFIRTWGVNRVANQIVASLSPDSRAALEAYAAGVNAFIRAHQDRLPVEFAILQYKPEPWKIEDSVAIIRLMAWRLSFSWYVDLVLSELQNKLGLGKARQVFPDFPRDAPTIISSKTTSPTKELRAFLNAGLALREFLGLETQAVGSNSWVVSGKKSASGKPLLANDPHLELTTPSIWYEMHLSGGAFDVAGVALPGTPGILIGHNRKIAWGLTNGMVDDVDFYLEQIDPDDSTKYSADGQWLEFEEIRETIGVKNERSETITIRKTRNGPVVSDIHPVLSDTDLVYAMRWVGHQPSDELLTMLKINVAEDWGDFREALKFFKVPAQNFTFASVDGDIGYQLAGEVPIRNNTTGILSHQGWRDTGQWQRSVPFERLPSQFNPQLEFIVTANNRIVDESYPYYITNLWEPHGRATRITHLLMAKEKFTIQDFRLMQNDVTSVLAQKLMPILLTAVENHLDSTDTRLLELYGLIKDWDGHENVESIATSIFHAFFVRLAENTLEDEMGEQLYQHYIRLGNVPFRVIPALLQRRDSVWFDDVTTPQRETKDDIIVASLKDGGALLEEMAGENISDWAWGRLHTLTMRHPLGRQSPIDELLNLGPYSRGGSMVTVNNSQYRFAEPFASRVGPSTRQLVDLSNMDRTLSVITSGQSGQRMSDHYKDQTPLWLNGRYHYLYMDKDWIIQTAASHLVLEATTTTN